MGSNPILSASSHCVHSVFGVKARPNRRPIHVENGHQWLLTYFANLACRDVDAIGRFLTGYLAVQGAAGRRFRDATDRAELDRSTATRPCWRNSARHPTSILPLWFWAHSGWINVSYCSRDCQCTLHRGPIFIALAAVLADLMGGDASICAICCAHYSRIIDLTAESGAGPLATARAEFSTTRRGGSR